MLSLYNDEMFLLELKFNSSKCHVLCVGKNYNSKYSNVTINGIPVAHVESVTYLGQLSRLVACGVQTALQGYDMFKAFNSIYYRSPYLSEPTMQQIMYKI